MTDYKWREVGIFKVFIDSPESIRIAYKDAEPAWEGVAKAIAFDISSKLNYAFGSSHEQHIAWRKLKRTNPGLPNPAKHRQNRSSV